MPTDEHGVPVGPAYDEWIAQRETADEACWQDWDAEHFQPLLGYEPDTQLILATDEGGQRHYLNGRRVHPGAGLELLLDDGRWVAIRYE
jgi:hypothetical protein